VEATHSGLTPPVGGLVINAASASAAVPTLFNAASEQGCDDGTGPDYSFLADAQGSARCRRRANGITLLCLAGADRKRAPRVWRDQTRSGYPRCPDEIRRDNPGELLHCAMRKPAARTW
jgi:hypothetical protein